MERNAAQDPSDDEAGAWFVPRSFGLGATPVTWQGWAVTLGYVALLTGALIVVRDDRLKAEIGIGFTVALFVIAFAKTSRSRRRREGDER